MTIDRRNVLQGMLLAGAMGKAPIGRSAGSELRDKLSAEFAHLPPQSSQGESVAVYAMTALGLSRLAAATTRCQLDVAYGSDPAQKLDIYLPEQQGLTGLPIFCNIHGGGWTHGYKEWMGLNAPPIVAFPAIYISIGYRLAPASKHPAQLDDTFRALAWVHGQIAKLGGDPERLYVGGHSAGAHLSALITLRTDLYARYGLPAGVVKACFAYNGVYDLRNVEIYGEHQNPGEPLLPGASSASDASPIVFVNGNRTPFFVTWAENDGLLIKAESAAFAAALAQQAGRVETHMFPDFDHFWSHIDQQRPQNPWTRTLRSWMTGDPHTAPVFTS